MSHSEMIYNFTIRSDELIKIDYGDERFSDKEYPGWSFLERKILEFTRKYECQWHIIIDGYCFDFSYRPDLATVFLKIPLMLDHIVTSKPGNFVLYFFEQGTDLAINIRNVLHYVRLSFKKYDQSRFKNLPSQIAVEKKNYCEQWIGLADKVLTEIRDVFPDLSIDDEFIKYNMAINNIKRII